MNNTDIFALAKCQYCGNQHDGICHLIKSIEFFENGLVKKVEFKDSESSGVEATPVYEYNPSVLGEHISLHAQDSKGNNLLSVSPDGHNLY